MARQKPSTKLPAPKQVKTDLLMLDAENPRIGSEGRQTQEELLKTLYDEYSVDEIALSIAENGFFEHEPLFATHENIVIEGNRRLAAVKLLRSEKLRTKIGAKTIPAITKQQQQQLDTLPVIVAAKEDVWRFTGFKHINGPQPWTSAAKAQYVAWVHDELKVDLKKIAETIGDQHATVSRLYHAQRVLVQAQEAEIWSIEDRYKNKFSFSHLMTGLGYAGISEFLGIDASERAEKSPVPKKKLKELGELLVWMFGDKKRSIPPQVVSQNPDLRILDDVLKSQQGIVALRNGTPLRIAAEIAKGDEQVFRAALQQSKENAAKAMGTVVTGYGGDLESFEIAQKLKALAEKLVDDMDHKRQEASSPKAKTRARKKK